jgi:hypothetical protein
LRFRIGHIIRKVRYDGVEQRPARVTLAGMSQQLIPAASLSQSCRQQCPFRGSRARVTGTIPPATHQPLEPQVFFLMHRDYLLADVTGPRVPGARRRHPFRTRPIDQAGDLFRC